MMDRETVARMQARSDQFVASIGDATTGIGAAAEAVVAAIAELWLVMGDAGQPNDVRAGAIGGITATTLLELQRLKP